MNVPRLVWKESVADKLLEDSASICREQNRPSMLYTLLPTVIQNRIPKVLSIRQTVSDFRGRPVLFRTIDRSTGDKISETPPPCYTSRQGSVTRNRASMISTDGAATAIDLESQDEGSISERPSSSGSTLPLYDLAEDYSGVNWKYANQGIGLITQACEESTPFARDDEDDRPPFNRQLYMHGLTYLLRGLPTDMGAEEAMSIQAAVPSVVLDLHHNPNAQALIATTAHGSPMVHDRRPEELSVLHRITAAMVLQFFLTVQFLLPYIKLLIGYAYRLEREHKVTQRVFTKSIDTVDDLGKKALRFTNSVCSMNDGQVGQAINDFAIWWVQGFTGGLHQGISEGVVVLQEDMSRSSRSRKSRLD